MARPPPSLPVFGSDRPPVASTDDPRVHGPARSLEREIFAGRNRMHSGGGCQRHAGVFGGTQQGVEHVFRAVGAREELAVRLLLERHADAFEERDGRRHREGPQDTPDDRPLAAPVVLFSHHGVGDIASAAAADENLGAGPCGAIEEDNGSRRIELAREDRRCETGRAGADDGNLFCRRRRLARFVAH